MAKIENEPEKAAEQTRHTFEVLVSFDSLARGATFGSVPDEWTRHRVAAGYLEDRGEEATDVGSEEGSR